MKKRPEVLFVLTIDTEEEWDWGQGYPTGTPSVQNTQKIPKFQAFCNELRVKPTYFIDYAIVADKASVERFRAPLEKGECEIGGHLHPWVTPPVEETVRTENTHAINLPSDLVKRKLDNLTGLLEKAFGERPLTFRSGRWGVNGTLLKILVEEGYQTDSSVFPFYADSAFSYYGAPEVPYWPDFNACIREAAQREIFEIPVTSGFDSPNFPLWDTVHQLLSKKPWSTFHGVGILWHLHIMRKLSLSPELEDASDMIALIKACLKRDHRIIHMFLHSSTLLPGGSPYVSNQKDEENFYQKIADVIDYLQANTDVSFCTLTEAKQRYLQEENT